MNYIITVESSVAMQPDTFQIVKVTHVSTTTNEFTVRTIHTLLYAYKLSTIFTRPLILFIDYYKH